MCINANVLNVFLLQVGKYDVVAWKQYYRERKQVSGMPIEVKEQLVSWGSLPGLLYVQAQNRSEQLAATAACRAAWWHAMFSKIDVDCILDFPFFPVF